MMEQELLHAQRLATLLSGGIRGGGYYPPGHPAALKPFREMASTAAALARGCGEVRVAVVDGVLSVGEHLFFAPTAPLQELSRRLEEKNVLGLTFKDRVTPGDLMELARLMAQPLAGADEVSVGLRAAAIDSIEVNQVDALSQIYREAVGAIRELFTEVASGRIPDSRRMVTVVGSLACAAVREPASLLGLTLLKNYDHYTFQHSVNVGVLAMALSAAMGQPRREVEQAGMAGFLHDIGKVRIGKEILNKPGKLSEEEYLVMKRHPEYGAEIARELEDVPERVAEAVLGHHIRYDREGYPEWARSLNFGVTSGIVSVADFYDATTTLRAYQRPMQPKQAVEKIRNVCGTILNGDIVERFLELTGKFPTGSLVRLDSNEIAIVVTPGTGDSGAKVVKVILDGCGRTLEEPELRTLAQTGERIVDLVDPLVRGIDVSSYF